MVLIREGAILRGVAPIGIRRTRTRTCVQLLGGGYGSDRVDLLTARGFEAACSDALLAWAGGVVRAATAFVLELRDVPDDSPIWGAVQRAGFERTQRLALQPREIHTLPYLPLTGPTATARSMPGRSRDGDRSRSIAACWSAAAGCESMSSRTAVKFATAFDVARRVSACPMERPRRSDRRWTTRAWCAFTAARCRCCSLRAACG